MKETLRARTHRRHPASIDPNREAVNLDVARRSALGASRSALGPGEVLARLRLAGVLLDEKAYDEALALLAQKHAAPMEAQYAALKGDVLVAKNSRDDARAAYRLALEKTDSRSGAFRASVQLRLDALGG